MKVSIIISLLVLALSLFTAQWLARYWAWTENVGYNVLNLLNPYIFSLPPLDGTTPQEQSAHFAKQTAMMSKPLPQAMYKWYGKEFHEAAFGETQTKVMETTVPDRNKEHDILIICNAPRREKKEDKGRKLPLVFHFFGGGLIIGSPRGEIWLERWLAREAHAVVCSVDYRVAPLFPYPTPVNDCIDGVTTVLNSTFVTEKIEAELEVSIDKTRIATFGVSAGGYIAAHVARQLGEYGHKVACHVVLVPIVKPFSGTQSALKHFHTKSWGGIKVAYSWASYLRDDVDGSLLGSPYVNLLAPTPDPTHQPPGYVQVHSKDVLRDEGVMYAQSLEKQGKLIGIDEFDTGHIGSLPGISRGGPGEEAFPKAVSVLKQCVSS